MIRTNWRESVDRVERELAACLTALDRYEQSFRPALEPGPTVSEQSSPSRIDSPSVGFAERLATANERASSVERLLAEQERVWREWHSSVLRWKETLKQPPENSSLG